MSAHYHSCLCACNAAERVIYMFMRYEDTLNRKRITKNILASGELVECVFMESLRPSTREEYDQMTPEEQARHKPVAPLSPCTFDVTEEILCEQDVAITLRDGVTIYVDVFRPKNGKKAPAILAWSPYGKKAYYTDPDLLTRGVPASAISHYTKEEAADPLFWCHYGYAIVNVDPRGIGHSEGDATLQGTQEAQDGYDVVEAVAAMPWCNGRVGLAGNSYLAISQWGIAAEQPPHLACIAPWEGMSDFYREGLAEGGVPSRSFPGALISAITGEGYVEDWVAMLEKYPDFNCAYWRDKKQKYERIICPAYICAGWSHFHLRGTMNAYRFMASKDKWLRLHRDFEWPDFYSSEGLADLKRFFDRYLMDIRNGWELTPKVRIQVMDVLDLDYQTNRPETEFPIPRTVYSKLFLDAGTLQMHDAPISNETNISYDGETGFVNFDYYFKEETELSGYMKLKLWVEAKGNDDMDLFINIQKLSTTGEWLPTEIFHQRHPGAWGKMRVSRRRLDEDLSTDYNPVQAHDTVQKLTPGEVVPIEIEIVPTSRIWHAGQAIRVQIAGHYIRDEWFEPLAWETDNKGTHVIHTGGKYDSYLQIPIIPPKFQDGPHIIR